jgi:hypothetical protein
MKSIAANRDIVFSNKSSPMEREEDLHSQLNAFVCDYVMAFFESIDLVDLSLTRSWD